jgi:hypothetical protein
MAVVAGDLLLVTEIEKERKELSVTDSTANASQ